MAFPDDRMPILLEAAFGADAAASPLTWDWTAITAAVHQQQVTVTRGLANEASEAQPTSISLELDNPAGDYTPDNPLGAHYPGVDLGVPVRWSLGTGTPYLVVGRGGRATTPDTAALDITGPIDIRVEVALDDWESGQAVELCAKHLVTGDQRSWLMMVGGQGELILRWSPDGTGATLEFGSTLPIPVPESGRIALRSTLNTANRQVTHYTAPSIAGPWTQLGSPNAAGAATTIFNSTAPVTVGDIETVTAFLSPSGGFYAFQLRNGIGGTLVADVDLTAQTEGAASFTDATGLLWTLAGPAEIAPWQRRFLGHADEWAPTWPYGDLSNEDVGYEGEARVALTASGTLRRLGQGQPALDSTLRRRIPSFGPMAYWPMEDGASASRAYSPITGVAALTLTRVTWAGADSLASSNPLPVLASSGIDLPMMSGRIPAPAATLTSWAVRWIYRLDSEPATLRTFMRILSTGTVAEWYIQQRADLSRIFGLAADGTTVFTLDVVTGTNLYNDWLQVRFTATQNGGNVDWSIAWFNIGGGAGGIGGSFAGTVGRPTGVASPPDGYSSDLDGMALGHISAWPSNTTAAYSGAIDAWDGERAGTRMVRLCEEEGIPLALIGDPDDTEQVGPQRPDTLLSLLAECARADQGLLGEQRAARGLRYRTRTSLYNQTPGLLLDAAANEIANPFAPVLDDQRFRNTVTVSREGGSSATALDEASITRRGRYEDPVTVNAYSDDRLPQLAGWRLHLGTWPGMRYPSVTIDLAIAPQLITDWLALDSGDRLQVINLPPQHPTDTVDLLLQGYTETVSPTRWTVTGNCTPAGPWTVGIVGDTVLGRADTDGSELAAGVDADDLSLSVAVTDGPLWDTDPGEFPFDILVGGEVMTVTAISGASSPQTFTIGDRSVNGTVKGHSAGTGLLRLAHQTITAL